MQKKALMGIAKFGLLASFVVILITFLLMYTPPASGQETGNVNVTLNTPMNYQAVESNLQFSASTNDANLADNVTFQYFVDGTGWVTIPTLSGDCVNISGGATPPYTVTCDTSKVPDGTYNVSALIDITGVNESRSNNATNVVFRNVVTVTGTLGFVNSTGYVSAPMSELNLTGSGNTHSANIIFTNTTDCYISSNSTSVMLTPSFNLQINRYCNYTIQININDPLLSMGTWYFYNTSITMGNFNTTQANNMNFDVQLVPGTTYDLSTGGSATNPTNVNILGGVAINYTSRTTTVTGVNISFARRGVVPEYVYVCKSWNYSTVSQTYGGCYSWDSGTNYVGNSSTVISGTHIDVQLTSPNIGNDSVMGVFIGEATTNPRPRVSGDSVASISVTKWGSRVKQYYAWVPLMRFNESGPSIAKSGYIEVQYYDKPFFEDPDYIELFSLNLTANITPSKTGNISVAIKPSINSSNNETKLLPAWTITRVESFAGVNVTRTILSPAFGVSGLTLYYTYNNVSSGNSTNCGPYVNDSCTSATCEYTNSSYTAPALDRPCANIVTYNWGTREMNITQVPVTTGEEVEITVLYALSDIGTGMDMFTPINLVNQSLAGSFIPGPNEEPPEPGESSDIVFIIEVNNNLTTYRATDSDLFIYFLYPKNVTCLGCSANGANVSADMGSNFQLWMNRSGYAGENWTLIANETQVWNGTAWLNANSVTSNNRVFSNSSCTTFTDSWPDSPAYNKNITLCFQEFRFNLTSVNNWLPNDANSNVSLKMNATLYVNITDETIVGNGSDGAWTTYNASISTGSAGSIDLTRKVPNINASNVQSYLICLDGNCTNNCDTSSICDIGSLTVSTTTSGTHTVSATYGLAATTTTTTTTTTAGSGDTTTASAAVTKTWSIINPGAAVLMSITKEGLDVTEISLEVVNPANSVSITVTKLDSEPAAVTQTVSGNAYQYIQIDKTNLDDSNVQSAKIRFRVGKTWMSTNNIDEGSVVLNRWANGQWNALTTTMTSEDDTYVYFEADTPGFSYFVVTGETVSAAVCSAGEKRCSGSVLQECASDGSVWNDLETCEFGCSEGACNVEPGLCTPGARQCVGDVLQECSGDGSAWSTVETCEFGCSEGACNEAPAADYTWVWIVVVIVIVVVAILVFGMKR